MSKPRSKLFDYKNTKFREVRGFTTAIHFGRQAKHLPDQPNYDPTKSTITLSIKTLQNLVEHHAGTGEFIPGTQKENVDFGIIIGIFLKQGKTNGVPTTRGTIHYSKQGAHVVPAQPILRKGK